MMNQNLQTRQPTQVFKSEKIQHRQLERLAIIYIRQSTIQQVERHQESTRRQYALKDLAIELGWAFQQVLVIDEDLGQSASSSEGRKGFQRLIAEVGLDRVGIILGIEISRLARSCRDWYHLLEICAVFGTLIGDGDGIYDPSLYNDRLLLGLKGTMSEAELHILKQRMLEGKRAKARRGELGMRLPMGYFSRPSGEVIKDPDEQAQSVIQLIFSIFERVQTINGVLSYFAKNKIQLPCRVHTGEKKDELEWRRPTRMTLSNLLHHPIYAGAYSYGRRPTDPKKKKPGRPSTGRMILPIEEWEVLIKDHLPAYISWDQYEKNLRQLEMNTVQGMGPTRNGPSLLSGLLICGRCGFRMSTQYSNNGSKLRYVCSRAMVDYGAPLCQSLAGEPLDQLTSELVLQALEPAALEVSLKATENLEKERLQLQQQWKQRLERARYNADRVFRQYNAVEPENRLVARSVEKQWEEALAEEEKLKVEYERFLSHHPVSLSSREKEAIRQLSTDLPALWHSPETSSAERQAIVRQMLERIVVFVRGESEKVDLTFHWIGGHQTETTLIRPVSKLDQLSYYPELLKRAAVLHEKGYKAKEIASVLNQEGWRPAKRRETFTAPMICVLLSRQGIRAANRRDPLAKLDKEKDEWTINELSGRLQIPKPTLHAWAKKGLIKARLDQTLSWPIWIVHADDKEMHRIGSLRNKPRKWAKHVSMD